MSVHRLVGLKASFLVGPQQRAFQSVPGHRWFGHGRGCAAMNARAALMGAAERRNRTGATHLIPPKHTCTCSFGFF